MTEKKFVRLMERYKRAWEEKNPDLAAELFADDIEYPETPFGPPACGRDGLKRYWTEAIADQTDIRFSWTNMFLEGDRGALEWECTYETKSTGARATLKGAMFFLFEGERIKRFREYWHKHVEDAATSF